MLVYVHFNIRQQLRSHLDLIDQERRFIPLQKQPRFRHCQAAYVDIVHRHISPVAFCQPAQQSRLSYLTRPSNQKYLTTTAQFFNCRLQMAFDVHRMSSFIINLEKWVFNNLLFLFILLIFLIRCKAFATALYSLCITFVDYHVLLSLTNSIPSLYQAF